MVIKPAKEYTGQDGQRRIKGNMDIELAVDMLELAPRVDHIILMSGDGDFRRLVEAVKHMGIRVSVTSSIKTQPPLISGDICRQADNFIELQDMRATVSKPDNSVPSQTKGKKG
jgi:uncharacterized LabA/DUF88 family protein